MAFVTIAGVDYEVIANEPEGETERRGKVERMFGNALRSSIRLEKEKLTFTLFDMTRVTFATLRNAVAYGVPVTVGGDAMPFGAPISASVVITSYRYIRDDVGFLIRPEVEITEA